MQTQIIQASQIAADPQDRTTFDAVALASLAGSIYKEGLLQPITVRPVGADQYRIVAGERRFRACLLNNWTAIPCIVREMSDEEASAGQLVENMARLDLDPIDEGRAYQKRIDLFGWDVGKIAQIAGVTSTRVQFRIKLLKLRDELQALVRSQNLPLGYAQILADADLDHNFQSIAIDRLTSNPAPTPAWFRREVGALVTKQNQVEQFDPFENPDLYAQPAGDVAAQTFASVFGVNIPHA